MKIYNENSFYKLPDAILFDTDNTLYAYDPAHEAAQSAVRKKVVAKFGLTVSDFDKAFFDARQQVKRKLGPTAASHNRLIYIQRMLELIGLGSQVLVALDLEQTYWREFLAKAELFSEVKDVLDDLRLLGIPLAIVTDLTAQIQFRKIVYFELESYFDFIVTSEEAGADKPAAAPFLLALEKLNPKGTNIWMIGDNANTDIQGAKAHINAVTIQKLHSGLSVGTGEFKPDASFRHFSDLRKLISRLSKSSIDDE